MKPSPYSITDDFPSLNLHIFFGMSQPATFGYSQGIFVGLPKHTRKVQGRRNTESSLCSFRTETLCQGTVVLSLVLVVDAVVVLQHICDERRVVTKPGPTSRATLKLVVFEAISEHVFSRLPSGNQNRQWQITHLQMIFR